MTTMLLVIAFVVVVMMNNMFTMTLLLLLLLMMMLLSVITILLFVAVDVDVLDDDDANANANADDAAAADDDDDDDDDDDVYGWVNVHGAVSSIHSFLTLSKPDRALPVVDRERAILILLCFFGCVGRRIDSVHGMRTIQHDSNNSGASRTLWL